jgi:hypothetical protein
MALHASLEKQQKVLTQQSASQPVPLISKPAGALDSTAGVDLTVSPLSPMEALASKKRSLCPSRAAAAAAEKTTIVGGGAEQGPNQVVDDGKDTEDMLLVQGLHSSSLVHQGASRKKGHQHNKQAEPTEADDPELAELEASLFGEAEPSSSSVLLGTTPGFGAQAPSDTSFRQIERIMMLLLKVTDQYCNMVIFSRYSLFV